MHGHHRSAPYLYYQDADAALTWLEECLDFTDPMANVELPPTSIRDVVACVIGGRKRAFRQRSPH
jgi:hypothetical protein